MWEQYVFIAEIAIPGPKCDWVSFNASSSSSSLTPCLYPITFIKPPRPHESVFSKELDTLALTPRPKDLRPPPLNTNPQTPLQQLQIHAKELLPPTRIPLDNLIQRKHRTLLPRPLNPLLQRRSPLLRPAPIYPRLATLALFPRLRLLGRTRVDEFSAVAAFGGGHVGYDGFCVAQGEAASQRGVCEERGGERVDEGEGEDAVVAAVGLDERGPGG